LVGEQIHMTMTDPRPTKMKREMAQHFAEMEAEYRDEDWANIVYEDDQVVLVEDTVGIEFDEWRTEFSDEPFSETMHNLADQLVDHPWSSTYPVVFDKLE